MKFPKKLRQNGKGKILAGAIGTKTAARGRFNVADHVQLGGGLITVGNIFALIPANPRLQL